MRALLTNVPSPRLGWLRAVFPGYPPLGMAYIAAALERQGVEVSIVDLENHNRAYLRKVISRVSPDLIGVSASMPMYRAALQLAEEFSQVAPSSVCLIGGPLTAQYAESLVEDGGFDGAVVGEAETLIPKIIARFKVAGDTCSVNLTGIPGIVTKVGSRINQTQPDPPPDDLDSLPLPARHLLEPRSLYLRHPLISRHHRATNIATSRGCVFNCTFCYQYPFKKRFRTHSVNRILEEIDEVSIKHGVTFVRFIDDCFTHDSARIDTLCEALRHRNSQVFWHCNARFDQLDSSLLKKMYTAGCRAINVGIESGDLEDHRRMSKGLHHNQETLIHEAVRLGIAVTGQFILGFPWDTPASLFARIRYAESLPLSAATFWPLIPFPGTRIYKNALDRFGEFDPDYAEKIGFNDPSPVAFPVYSPPGMSRRELTNWMLYAQLRFHLRARIVLPLLKNHFLG